MQREEKQLDLALDAIITRVNDLKQSISNMIVKLELEHETLNWPTFLDNFALMSGQLTALTKVLTHDKCPALRNLAVLPIQLSQERDTELLRITEQRVPQFSHDLAPDYLRTKLEPDVEQRMMLLESKAGNMTFEMAQKQVSAFNKVMNHVWDIVSKAREEWESESGSRSGPQQTTSITDTHLLVSAVSAGKNLKMPVPQGQPGPQGMMGQGRPGSGPPGGPVGGIINPGQQQMGPMGKVPSGIKTNIKAASQIHPYNR
ncbi:Mediator of RNA polymerase II transcription subunit 8 [Frankliniella fusca]|uniref:Mediator of RNA polymerase II transcription subunit 8 n=1 Tax=Frankliniella fusca TaxID=407009 RepID=A0AAE1H436_9NEOP|nr:Mediator of RNA polymerase II transcription subunit 8 [Frankliniella fusca]